MLMNRKPLITAVIIAATLGLLTASTIILPPSPVYSPPKSMTALGDSITQAANACVAWENCAEASWSTGSDSSVNSHASRIQALTASGSPLKTYNNARSFSTVSDLPEQALLALTQKPEYITILSGANDICSTDVDEMTQPADFYVPVRDTLELLSSKLPTAKIFVSSIPNLMELWRLGKDNPEAKVAWGNQNVCQSLLGNPDSMNSKDVLRRSMVEERIQKFNGYLEELCLVTSNCLWDGLAVYNHKFTVEELSTVDYFHPSIQGQQKIAELTWKSIPYGAIDLLRSAESLKNPNAPVVTVVNPQTDAVISGKIFTIVATVEYKKDIEKVFLDTQIGKFPLENTGEQWELDLDTTLAPDGTTTSFTVVAVDYKGNAGKSDKITVSIDNSLFKAEPSEETATQ
jgi:lysophospholipase L1-like esterase